MKHCHKAKLNRLLKPEATKQTNEYLAVASDHCFHWWYVQTPNYALVKSVKPSNIKGIIPRQPLGLLPRETPRYVWPESYAKLWVRGIETAASAHHSLRTRKYWSGKHDVNKPQIDLGSGRTIILKLFVYRLGLDWFQLAISVLSAVDVAELPDSPSRVYKYKPQTYKSNG